MSTSREEIPSFNLWYEPWITLEDAHGQHTRLGIEQTLLQAHQHTAIIEHSPLVVVGIRRLLAAILQAIFRPQRLRDLDDLRRQPAFPADPIRAFGARYAARFDLFSPTAPFLQSADLPLQPRKGDKIKTVAYLAPELPTGSEVIHFYHGSDDAYVFCPVCVAGCLCALPPFATAGGQGIRPSINGVPPIYVLPEGRTLFESLVYSLVLPNYQPTARSRTQDLAWWEREPTIQKSREVSEVGYLHSLTFPARQVRLHPERLDALCSRCGNPIRWGVRTMIYEMGEYRPQDAPVWFDPFAAYILPQKTKSDSRPRPIRPQPNHALWREYASLFLTHTQGGEQNSCRPSVLDQLAELTEQDEDVGLLYSFRCVGLRTDMKAKVFEWVEAGFEVPPALLRDPQGGAQVRQAIEFANRCAKAIRNVFTKNWKVEARLCASMEEHFWTALAAPFRQTVLRMSRPEQRSTARGEWIERCVREAKNAFRTALEHLGDDAATLEKRFISERNVSASLNKLRKEYLPDA
ncbi:MAG: type I-E CRISPR-associated protein Cse1/CasA [Anaerolineae bacterium]